MDEVRPIFVSQSDPYTTYEGRSLLQHYPWKNIFQLDRILNLSTLNEMAYGFEDTLYYKVDTENPQLYQQDNNQIVIPDPNKTVPRLRNLQMAYQGDLYHIDHQTAQPGPLSGQLKLLIERYKIKDPSVVSVGDQRLLVADLVTGKEKLLELYGIDKMLELHFTSHPIAAEMPTEW